VLPVTGLWKTVAATPKFNMEKFDGLRAAE
jgi:hypothetical protein